VKRSATTWIAWVAVAATGLVLATMPLFVTDRFVLKVLTFIGINAIVVTGLALLFGYAGQVSLGHAAFVGMGAYTCALITARWHGPWLLAVVAAGAVAAAGGLLLALPSLRLKGHYLAMATLGFGEIMSLFFVEAEPLTGGVNGFTGIPFPAIGAFVIKTPAGLYWLVWGVAALALLVGYNLVTLRPGRAMRAVHGSELGALASGVDVVGVKVRAFVISAALAGVAGALYASFVGFVSPSVFTLSASVTYLAMAVLGGAASLAGPLAATILLTSLEYVDALVPGLSRSAADAIQQWAPDVYGLAIILVVLFAPAGVGGLLKRLDRGRSS
jgi:branched-chain amino acid transport system permease protein